MSSALCYGFTLLHHRLKNFLEKAQKIIYSSLIKKTKTTHTVIFQASAVECTVAEPLPTRLGSGGS